MTLIDQVKSGQIPERVRKVAEREQVEVEKLATEISLGTVVIPQNLLRSAPDGAGLPSSLKSGKLKLENTVGIGRGLRTKVNANLGTSEDFPEVEEELKKLRVALKAGADTIMDLSTGGNLTKIRREILAHCPAPLGTVPIYEAAVKAQEKYGSIVEMTAEDIFQTIEAQAQEGIDFMTVHCGVCWKSLEALEKEGRVMDVVSRGGAFTIGWMIHHQKENPLYEDFDRLLEIARTYDVTLSLGDGMRPGCLADASDRAQFTELLVLGELVERARNANVQGIVEGPGHLPLDHIEANVRLEKEVCQGAPFYVLGPLVTDIAPGYDHITSAMGGALAAAYGADFLCYVTPKEHLGLPTAKDVREGVIAARIAAHAADIVKKVPGAGDWDAEMAKVRKALNWKEQEKLSIDPEKTRQFYEARKSKEEGVCTMCSGYCAMKLVGEYLQVEYSEKCL